MHALRRALAAAVGGALSISVLGLAAAGAAPALAATSTTATSTSVTSPTATGTGSTAGAVSTVDWPSGVFDSRAVNTAGVTSFGSFRGRAVDVALTYSPRDSWNDFATNLWGVKQFATFPGRLSVAIPLTIGSSTLAQVAAGTYDSYFRSWARNLAAAGRGNSDIRIGWEFNGNWMPWSAYDPSTYIAAFRHVSALIKGILPASQIDWNGNWGNSQCGHDALSQLYPGDAYVDVIGVDAYDGGWVPANTDAAFASWLTYKGGLQDWYDFAVAHGKKFSVPEWGLVPTNEGDNPAFVRGMYNFFAVHAAHLAFESYFDGATNALQPALMPQASALYQQLWSQTVLPAAAPAPLALVPAASSDPWGSNHTFSSAGLPGTATGTVGYSVNGAAVCSAAVVNGTASCKGGAALAPGSYPLTAAYTGDGHFAATTSGGTLTVLRRTPAMVAVTGSVSVGAGGSANLAVSNLPGSASAPVTFASRGTTLCQAKPVGGRAHCGSPTSLAAGSYPVTASWPGDALFLPATATMALTVTPITRVAAVAIAPSVSTGVWGATHAFSVASLPGTATGRVTYSVGGRTVCTATVARGGAACRAAVALNPGRYQARAAYSGDLRFPATSANTAFTVLRRTPLMLPARAVVTTRAGRSATVAVYRLPGSARGAVTFSRGATVLCHAAPVGGRAHCAAPRTLAVGTYVVTAAWGGNALFAPVRTTLRLRVIR